MEETMHLRGGVSRSHKEISFHGPAKDRQSTAEQGKKIRRKKETKMRWDINGCRERYSHIAIPTEARAGNQRGKARSP